MRVHLGKLSAPLDATLTQEKGTDNWALNVWEASNPKKAQCIILTPSEVFWFIRQPLDSWYSKMWETSIAAQVDDMTRALSR